MRRRVLRGFALLVAFTLLLVTAVVIHEWTYIMRTLTYPDDQVTDVGWYEPREPVRGGEHADLPVAASPAIPAAALAEAEEFARSRNSSALLLVHRGEIVAEHYWRGHDVAAPTNSMSMAKTVVALLVGIAIAEGAIGSVDEPAGRYLSEWEKDDRRRITIRHLLQMTSGLDNPDHEEDPTSDIGYMYLGTDSPYIVARVQAAREPGVRFEYNSTNTQALSMILERATRRRYADYLSEKLWRPVGARDASVWLDEDGGSAKAFCCLFATARDWARLGQLILDEGRAGGRQVVPAGWVRAMTTPSPAEPDYGYHIWLGNDGCRRDDHEEPFLGSGVTWLDGRHKQRVYIVPSHELVVVRVGEKGRDWDEAALPNMLLRGLGAGPRP